MPSRFQPFFLALVAVGALGLAACADSPGYYSVRAGVAAPYHGYYDTAYAYDYDLYPYYGTSYYAGRTGYVYPRYHHPSRYRYPTRVHRHPTRYYRTYRDRGIHRPVRYRRVPAHRYDRPRTYRRTPTRTYRQQPVRQWRSSRDRVRPSGTVHRSPVRAAPPRQRAGDHRR